MITKANSEDEIKLAQLLGLQCSENLNTSIFVDKSTINAENHAIKDSENKIENTGNEKRILTNSFENDVFFMQIKTLFMCYKTKHYGCDFYFVYPNENGGKNSENDDDFAKTGVLCVQGKTALYAGPMQDSEEIELFLNTLQVEYFKSNNMTLYNFEHVQMYIMCLKAGVFADVYACEVQSEPDLWALAHSGIISDIDADLFYADTLKRKQNGFADIRAVRILNKSGKSEYVSTAAVYTHFGENAYVTDVATKEVYRGKGFASTLLSTLARAHSNKNLYVVCTPKLESFYKQLGFVFMRPVCVFKAKKQEVK